jgi:YggT family protein
MDFQTVELILRAIDLFVWILDSLIFVRVIISWLPIDRNNPIVRFVYGMTEPILAPIRNLIFKSPLGGSGMMIDFSPVVAVLLLQLLQSLLNQLVFSMLR